MINDDFQKFVELTKLLRRECPWDREQTHASIRHSLIEEAYEVVESIEHRDLAELRNELGDILLHVVFHANIAEEEKAFTLADVIAGISEKLIRRHPHVFGDASVSGAKEVKQNWEKIKMSEGRESLLEGVPKELPALLRAHRLTDRASKAGFDWPDKEGAWKKVEEEIGELHESTAGADHDKTELELGDLLFAIVNYSRFLDINPENALRRTIAKFTDRFRYIEQKLREAGRDIHATPLAEMDRLWEEAKAKLPQTNG